MPGGIRDDMTIQIGAALVAPVRNRDDDDAGCRLARDIPDGSFGFGAGEADEDLESALWSTPEVKAVGEHVRPPRADRLHVRVLPHIGRRRPATGSRLVIALAVEQR